MSPRSRCTNSPSDCPSRFPWRIGSLAVLILVVSLTAYFALQNPSKRPRSSQFTAPAQQEQPEVDVLYSKKRIEAGTKLERQMFIAAPIRIDSSARDVVPADNGLIYGRFAARDINANMPLLYDDVAPSLTLSPFTIPAGYSLATVAVNLASGLESFAKPNTRVDVLWTYTENDRRKVATIVRFVKVVFAGQDPINPRGSSTTVTLLVKSEEAKRIELAKRLGWVTLALVGEEKGYIQAVEPDTLTIDDLLKTSDDLPKTSRDTAQNNQEPATHNGVIYRTDPRTGNQLRYLLENGRWRLDRSFVGNK